MALVPSFRQAIHIPRHADEAQMISAIILNWKRPQNVRRIVSGWLIGGLVSDAIIWNNNPGQLLEPAAGSLVINTSKDCGLYTRFAAGRPAKDDCVLIQDDDLELPAASLDALYIGWVADADLIHGVFGCAPKSEVSYAENIAGNAEVPIVLTRALLVHRRYMPAFFCAAARFSELQQEGTPLGNGENILLSYAVRRETGRLNRIHRVAVNELPDPDAIHIGDLTLRIELDFSGLVRRGFKIPLCKLLHLKCFFQMGIS